MKAWCSVLSLLVLVASASAVGIGDTRDDVIDSLGNPEAQIKERSRETLYYGNSTVELAHGVVIRFDIDVERDAATAKIAKPAPRPAQQAVVSAPRNPTPKEAVPTITVGKAVPISGAIQKISNGGQRVDMQEIVVLGKVTVVDFYADWCGPCRRISPMLENLANADEEVYLRKIDIVKWGTDVTQQFGIRSIPNIRVFNRNGQMVGQGTSNIKLVQQYVQQAK